MDTAVSIFAAPTAITVVWIAVAIYAVYWIFTSIAGYTIKLAVGAYLLFTIYGMVQTWLDTAKKYMKLEPPR